MREARTRRGTMVGPLATAVEMNRGKIRADWWRLAEETNTRAVTVGGGGWDWWWWRVGVVGCVFTEKEEDRGVGF
jgi:hypothetical protein